MKTSAKNQLVSLLCFVAIAFVGCSTTVDKAAVGKRVQANVAASSAEWKDMTYEGKLDGTITTAGANRTVSGHPCWFSFTLGTGG